MRRRLFLSLLTLWMALLPCAVPAQAPPPGATADGRLPGVEFLNERLRIPESEQFDEGAYIESGVGLRFGVEKRLTYFPGEYEEAAQNFEESVRAFRYKSEIWVFLARAYFYMKSPEKARDALERAQAVMPDLDVKLWRPLIASLEWEIRQRAMQQQAQIDYYSAGQEEVLSLFRLYLFLNDHPSASGLVSECHVRARTMRERAGMVSGQSRGSYMAESERWTQLGERLAMELRGIGVEPPAPPLAAAPPAESPQDLPGSERLRILQLRVDFYEAPIDDYLELFQAYFDAGDSLRARGVVTSLGRLINDLTTQASVAATVSEQVGLEEDVAEYEGVRDDMRAKLGDVPAEAAP